MISDELICALVVLAMFGALVSRRISPPAGVMAALLALFFLDVIGPDQAFAGFANAAPITIAALYVVAAGVDRTGALGGILRSILGGVTRRSGFARLLGGAAVTSSIVANTPIVAMLINPVSAWAERRSQPPSRFLIPLSYASILGGMVTVIGTSTNLIGSGLLVEVGAEPLGFFEPARIGGPVALIGLVVIALAGPRLMPARGGGSEGDRVAAPFTVSMVVEPGGPLDGVSVSEGELRDLPGVYLVALGRYGSVTAPVGPDVVLEAGDVLTFAGKVSQVVDLGARPGLRLDEDKHLQALDGTQHAWFEAVVGATSPLLGRSVKDVGFRSRYQAAVVALHRSGQGIEARLGDVPLQVGDSLLLVSDLDFRERWKQRGDFLLIQRRSEPPPTASRKSWISLAILVGVAALPLLGLVSVLKSALAGAAAMVVSGVLTPRQARDGVDPNVVLMIGAALGVGTAVRTSGLADRVAGGLIGLTEALGPWGVAFGVVLATLVLTELVTNAAAVAMVIPVALTAADRLGEDPRAFALGAIVAASASFLTPIGYQTNTMVYGPGRYQFTDYLRLGVPLTLVVLVVAPLLMTAS